jgi:molybdate transport system regulatory protein
MSDVARDATHSPSLMQALGHPLSDRRLQVLRALGECGSISQAARQVGVSYKAAWQAIDTLGNLAGVPVVEKSVGGAGGGGAKLTLAGHELLRAAQAMAQAKGVLMQQLQSDLPMQRLGIQTSMRNQWPCVVAQVELAGPLAVVHVHSAQGDLRLTARITAESAQLLGLQVGMSVIAMCKATAVQVAAATALPDSNTWPGKVTRVTAGAIGDEIAVQMVNGVQWVGFAAAGSGLRVGRKTSVHLPQAALVLALEG